MTIPAQEATKPWLESVIDKASMLWKEDLESLFHNAKDRLPDILWETETDAPNKGEFVETLCGYKGIVYARANPDFCAKYLSESDHSQSMGNHRLFTPDLRRLYTMESNLSGSEGRTSFEDNLRQDFISMWTTRLYTDVQIVISSSESLPSSDNVQDPLTVLSSQRFGCTAPVKSLNFRSFSTEGYIRVTTPRKMPQQSDNVALELQDIFSCHCFLLSLRSPYFHRHLSDSAGRLKNFPNEPTPVRIILPRDIFTRTSLNFILGYLYAGTQRFSFQDYDLSTVFSILRGSLFLELPDLEELITAHITVEMLHGLHYAFFTHRDYSHLVRGEWGAMVRLGCRCGICTRRIPRVLQFALEDGIGNEILERGARRGLIALFGEGWCTEEFSTLPKALFNSILTEMWEIITPSNAFPLLFAAEKTLLRLNQLFDPPRQSLINRVRARIMSVRRLIDRTLCTKAAACFKSESWKMIMEDDKCDNLHLQDEKAIKIDWIMGAISRGSNRENARALYQVITLAANLYREGRISGFPINAQFRIERMLADLLEEMYFGILVYCLPNIPSRLPTPRTFERIEGQTNVMEITLGTHLTAPCVSTPTSGLPFEEQTNTAHSAFVDALDLATSSSYSLASSRTISTDYSIYYTRRAISQETIQSWNSMQTFKRRRSCDSF